MKRTMLLGMCLVLLAFLLLPARALALGVAIGPQVMEIDNAVRGLEYERMITVFNPSPSECGYRVGAEGNVATWINFYDLKSKKAVQRWSIPGESNTALLVKVSVPSDIINGSYTSTIYAETATEDTSGNMGASAVLRSTLALTVRVVGTQIVDGTIGTITALDTEAGLPMRVLVNFQNTGNVAVRPRIDLQVNKGSSVVTTFSYDKTLVKPSSQENIPVEWATAKDQAAGEYTSKVTVFLGDKTIATKEIPFKVLPPGTLTKLGEFVSLNFEGQPVVGSMLKIQSDFTSTGQADVRAKLISEIYFGGTLIDTLKSEETVVPVGQTGTLISYLKLEKTGQYSIKAYVSYEGKQTGVKELKVDVTSGQTGVKEVEVDVASGQPSLPSTEEKPAGVNSLNPLYMIVIAAVAVSVIIITMILWRRRQTR